MALQGFQVEPLAVAEGLQVDPGREFMGSSVSCLRSTLSKFGAVELTSTGTKAS